MSLSTANQSALRDASGHREAPPWHQLLVHLLMDPKFDIKIIPAGPGRMRCFQFNYDNSKVNVLVPMAERDKPSQVELKLQSGAIQTVIAVDSLKRAYYDDPDDGKYEGY